MKTRLWIDTVVWIIAVVIAVLVRGSLSEMTYHILPTLVGCGILGFFWVTLRGLLYLISAKDGRRWFSAALTLVSAFGAAILALPILIALDIAAARTVLTLALCLAGLGWGLAVELGFRAEKPNVH